jgi:hypothetical protein
LKELTEVKPSLLFLFYFVFLTLALSGVKQNNQSLAQLPILVMNMLGKQVYQAKGTTNQTFGLGAQFVSGMYIVEIMHDNTLSTYKIVKGD